MHEMNILPLTVKEIEDGRLLVFLIHVKAHAYPKMCAQCHRLGIRLEHAPVSDNNGYHLLLPACAYALMLSPEEDVRHAVKYAIADERALLIFYPAGERLPTCAFVPSVPHWRLFIKELACIRGMSAATLAEQRGLPLARIEQFLASPDTDAWLSELEKLAGVFRVSMRELFADRD
ncbi:helix-turn-helix domain-containing protein [Thermosporothrix hazakensis]|jgi:hypothetical protein|nr:helix-turn-helix transcriptional regulator [Thermosporothrix hazakensis]GCE50692.1 hypothetical protein KTH_55610 [Thermosporothrix hazakensis]